VPAPPVTRPLDRRSDLGATSCTEGNASGAADRAWIVASIREFAGGVVNDAEKVVGYGDTLTDEQGTKLFDSWCPKRYAQGFVLYKLYTYAAATLKSPDA